MKAPFVLAGSRRRLFVKRLVDPYQELRTEQARTIVSSYVGSKEAASAGQPRPAVAGSGYTGSNLAARLARRENDAHQSWLRATPSRIPDA
ncbi:MAG: hypothetical protein H2073_17330 [Pseudomonas sp.]|jgi:hypothetical protein|uniref:hypothetical protein n=1 Tax=Stutzerimonas frequens TaxID=2968969 RepID=UPI00185E8D7E|nr:hypothetical protein [Stutzerimonas frequens]MBA4727753.1 hypothetical protein [Pseudomonas sp.]MBK3918200.1 hypothetical protein [Stutzerimonas frequens]